MTTSAQAPSTVSDMTGKSKVAELNSEPDGGAGGVTPGGKAGSKPRIPRQLSICDVILASIIVRCMGYPSAVIRAF
ncbi:hypothetical protein FJ543_31140 [Mesorhizobium sp. B2-5-7]|nr:hypothetical protein FJ432_29765 [Mesorhizobium sp. B2-6-5]TPJ37726.1 hypothetical protein FJ437_31800 [Mesorhizobium sp. B2-6-6]TPK05725.1 hypothetical protein FJ543_31140 [Mesorhizobium sp. B2-5-7]TPK18363.1 hypothetical protein FJ562_32620 [Mesorhizobium sp. B2-5-6]